MLSHRLVNFNISRTNNLASSWEKYIYIFVDYPYILILNRNFLKTTGKFLPKFMINKFESLIFCKFYACFIIGLCIKATEEYCKVYKIPKHIIAMNIFGKSCRDSFLITERWDNIKTQE